MSDKNENVKSEGLSRRRFVQVSSLAALAAGLALPSLAAEAPAPAAKPAGPGPSPSQSQDLERWMLRSGKAEIDEDLYRRLEQSL